ncbi:hypothetical protein [Maricaulis sp.]|uniref:hypothetical protein n=1 Tax=Maricaulis sp. TaxID=1486257 RepID=UPI002B26CC59|nr:hypothetical protein [Maricaulis sp.]
MPNHETSPSQNRGDRVRQCLTPLAAALAATVMTAAPALAQDAGDSERPAQALAAMIGTWEGSGWSMTPSRERETFDVFERVESVAGGHLVLVRGRGYAPSGAGEDGRLVHDAGGIVRLREDGGYEMFAATAMNGADAFALDITDAGYTWEIPLGPHGRVVYEAVFTADSWTETGRYCDPTGQCFPTLSMTLTRVAD